MENEISTTLDSLIQQEIHADEEISEKNDTAVRALEDLYASIEKLYILRKGTRDGLKSVDEFVNELLAKFGGVRIENMGARKDEIVNLLSNISWSIRAALDAINRFEKDSKQSE